MGRPGLLLALCIGCSSTGVWTMPGRRRGPRRPAQPRATSGVPEGEPAPDFTLRPPSGGAPVTLSALKGKPVALVFGCYT